MQPPSHEIAIEDDPCDVIAKAMRGLGISRKELTEKSNLTGHKITSILDGEIDTEALKKIATSLKLSPEALAGLSSYRPNITAPDGFEMIVSPFGHAGVNSFIISHGHDALVFDTGTDASPILDFLTEKKLTAAAVIITHSHHDHLGGIREFGNIPVIHPDDMKHGQTYTHAGISFKALDVSGHASPARAYFHEGLSKPVCIVGDCIFAGSCGGTTGPENYQLAMKTIRENILTLPQDTVLGTGHGPLTSLGQEMKHNPFLAK